MSIFFGGGYLMQSVVQEKESRIVEIMLSSARPTALLLGKTLAMAAVALLQVVVWIVVIVILLTQAGDLIDTLKGIEVSSRTLIVMAVYFVLGYLFFGSLMAAIGAFSTSSRAQNFVVVVTLPAMIPFFLLTLFAGPNGAAARLLSMIHSRRRWRW
jgi:ABC-2 type transport system permease protein